MVGYIRRNSVASGGYVCSVATVARTLMPPFCDVTHNAGKMPWNLHEDVTPDEQTCIFISWHWQYIPSYLHIYWNTDWRRVVLGRLIGPAVYVLVYNSVCDAMLCGFMSLFRWESILIGGKIQIGQGRNYKSWYYMKVMIIHTQEQTQLCPLLLTWFNLIVSMNI